ncbi:asparagine synthase B [Coprobacter fastidiosus]|uniref:asparagine synthase (glutamine-hydrolyzing) n=1 Tax=Coprobacter fastidiosus NSB1 = JCM 33896 TaxID=1349822 RepID=A0A495WID0_9BACT|nr:asparagine synthase B [Coprobacter fastidiosus]ERM89055.1 asparagine synthetase B [Coprobacter fastidiosus NSB1 = JCM 33896]RKT61502.1 asparagine synthase (glutamine-hydrolysing) [Coprobacter fastidiosus NSB1 = JCM 33896]BEG61573.1 asparagine synthase B [Coprobacter fastidiosus]HJF42369.1 asparagine synthase B [Coprobacter fastidiosus]
MCGIVAVLDIASGDVTKLRSQVLKMSDKLRHRGPDWSGIYTGEKAILAHERLSIVDPQSGGQPLKSKDGKIILTVNGEIYNHLAIREQLKGEYEFQTGSDCEVILALYRKKGIHFLEDLNGIFAFVLYDEEKDEYLVARDPIGVIPLYIGTDNAGHIMVASELKALEGYAVHYEPFLPGHYYYSKEKKQVRWYVRDWMEYDAVKDNPVDISDLKRSLEAAVQRQLMSDVPYGVLLSGGLDSSIISAIAKKYAAKRIENDSKTDAWWPQLHSFAVGLKGAPDLKAAKKVADYIGTVHHEINYTVQEGLDAIRNVIYYIETYDVTTVRASTPMYLLARVIKSMGIKMVLSGEGADEVFGGYLYFHKAPDAKAFHEETVRKISKLYLYDCLRANKSLSAWGVEGRVPFLDKEFLDVAMRLNPEAKMSPGKVIEKKILREAFSDMLPDEVVWRQKEQFSDGVGYSWIDSLKQLTSNLVSDEEMAHASEKFPVQTPMNKEEYYYRSVFEELFPSRSAALTVPSVPSVACSTAEALAWDEAFRNLNDPSGRAVKGVHADSY